MKQPQALSLPLLIALFVGAEIVPAAAQDTSPAATPTAGAPLDLAAMMLFPADLDAVGHPGFGQLNGSGNVGAGNEARITGRSRPEGAAGARAILEAAGYRRDQR